jgi:hypothetical protein
MLKSKVSKIWREPQISRRHNGDMKRATYYGPTNNSAALHNLVAHDLCAPDLSYNNIQSPYVFVICLPLVK